MNTPTEFNQQYTKQGKDFVNTLSGIRSQINNAIKALFAAADIQTLDILALVNDQDVDEISVLDTNSTCDEKSVTVEGVRIKRCDLIELVLRDSVLGEQYNTPLSSLSVNDCAYLLTELENIIQDIINGKLEYAALK